MALLAIDDYFPPVKIIRSANPTYVSFHRQARAGGSGTGGVFEEAGAGSSEGREEFESVLGVTVRKNLAVRQGVRQSVWDWTAPPVHGEL